MKIFACSEYNTIGVLHTLLMPWGESENQGRSHPSKIFLSCRELPCTQLIALQTLLQLSAGYSSGQINCVLSCLAITPCYSFVRSIYCTELPTRKFLQIYVSSGIVPKFLNSPEIPIPDPLSVCVPIISVLVQGTFIYAYDPRDPMVDWLGPTSDCQSCPLGSCRGSSHQSQRNVCSSQRMMSGMMDDSRE